MTIFRKAGKEDYKRLIELANHAFDEAHHVGDFEADTAPDTYFPRILPKLYQNEETAEAHWLAEEDDGTFSGLVGAFSLPTTVAGEPLRVTGIGTVCTRPGYRRRGLMLELMRRALEEAAANGTDYLVLGGIRQRYGHWGFENAGVNPVYFFEDVTMNYLFGEKRFPYEIRPLRKEERDLISAERELRLKDLIVVEHEEALEYDALCSMDSTPYVVLLDGIFRGTFLLSREENAVVDPRFVREEEALEILREFMLRYRLPKLRIALVSPAMKKLHEALTRSAAEIRVSFCEMLRVLSWERTLYAYFSAKSRLSDLADGELAVRFENGENLLLRVQNGVPSVEKTDAVPDLSLSGPEGVMLFFSNALFASDLGFSVPPAARSWFPLPFFMAMSDEV